jgi:hypothetical protein
MTQPPEHESLNNDRQALAGLEFSPEPIPVDEQHLALLDLQRTIVEEWVYDTNNFMVRLIDHLPSEINTASRLTRIYLGLRHSDDALGVRTEEIVVHAHSKIILPSLTPGGASRTQLIDRDICIVSTKDGDKKVARHFDVSDANLVESQIERLRQLQVFCPNISDDLMATTSTPSKTSAHAWRSDAFLSSRSQA